MSELFAKLQKQRMEARKGGTARALEATLLTTLVGEVTSKAKNDGNRDVTSEDVSSTAKKFFDSALEVIHFTKSEDAMQELEILRAYLPVTVSDDVLKEAIKSIILEKNLSGPKAIGAIMSALKSGPLAGKYDGKKANELIKSLI